MERIAIAGGPKTGKTRLAETYSGNIKHTDDLIRRGWERSSSLVCDWFDDVGVSVIEGVAVPRALRKWLRRNKVGAPVDRVIYLDRPYLKLTTRQFGMAKSCMTVWLEIVPILKKRGVGIGGW